MTANVPKRAGRVGPLAGIRITDVSSLAAGPYGTELLAFLGAEVIRVESRERLDFLRVRNSAVFNELNENKLSVTLNLKKAKAVELVKGLVRQSDVFVEGWRPGVMDRLGLGYDALRCVKPDIVMASVSGFGQTGPQRNHAAYASIFAAMGGLSYVTGYEDGIPTEFRAPGDLRVGMYLALGILCALMHRRRTGEGQYIDLSATEATITHVGEMILDYQMNDRIAGPMGNRDQFMAPHNCYRCRGQDRWVSIAVASDEEWAGMRHAMGDPAWAGDERFSDLLGRWNNRVALDAYIEQWTAGYTPYEVTTTLQAAGVASFPTITAEDAFGDPHLKARGFVTEIEYPQLGMRKTAGRPWRLSRSLPALVPAPELGGHNADVLMNLLGLSREELGQLIDEGVVY